MRPIILILSVCLVKPDFSILFICFIDYLIVWYIIIVGYLNFSDIKGILVLFGIELF